MAKFTILFVLVYLGGIFGALFVDGAWGIYLYMIEYFLNPRIRWWFTGLPDIRYSFIIAVSILLGFVFRIQSYSSNRFFDFTHNKWLIGLALWMGFVSFYAVSPDAHIELYIRHLKILLIVYLIIKLIDTPIKFERMISFFLIGSFYLGWLAHDVGRTGSGRLEGVGPMDSKESNGLATVLTISIPILFFYILEGKKKWQKAVSLIFLAYILNAIVLINSRGSFLGLIVGLSYYFYFIFFKNIKKFNHKFKMGVGVFSLLALFVYLTDNTFWERMDSITPKEDQELDHQGGSRMLIWKMGLIMANDYPFGVGGHGFHHLSPQYIPEKLLTRGSRAPHSTWIKVLTEYGYVGFILFLGFLISLFWLNWQVRKKLLLENKQYLYYQNVALNASLVGFLVTATFMDRLYAEMLYWIPAFMCCFANIYTQKKLSD